MLDFVDIILGNMEYQTFASTVPATSIATKPNLGTKEPIFNKLV